MKNKNKMKNKGIEKLVNIKNEQIKNNKCPILFSNKSKIHCFIVNKLSMSINYKTIIKSNKIKHI